MQVRQKLWSIFVMAAFALASAGPTIVSAADPERDWGPPHATIHIHVPSIETHRPTPSMSAGRFELQHFDHVLKEVHGKTHRIGTLDTWYSPAMTTTDGGKMAAGAWIAYKFEEGDLVPMLDVMYKVVVTGAASFELDRVTDDDLVKNLPKDLSLIVLPAGSSLTLDISQIGGTNIGERAILDLGKISDPGPTADARRARITVRTPGKFTAQGGTWITKETDFAVGDVIPLVKDCQLTVKKIVPPDEKHNILGWVEFDPNPPKKREQADNK